MLVLRGADIVPFMLTRILGLALVGALIAAAPAQAADTDLPKLFKSQIPKIKRATEARVLLPDTLPGYPNENVTRVYASGGAEGENAGWSLSASAARRCGANACFVASFSAEPGGRPSARTRVRLARGITGYFRALSCGGSCSPPYIEFRSRGILYRYQARVEASENAAQRAVLKRMADEAIRAGAR